MSADAELDALVARLRLLHNATLMADRSEWLDAADAITALREELRGRTQNLDDACATIARLEQTNSAALDKAERERDAARAENEKLRALLRDIKTDPHGCRFCDDGVLRIPNNLDKDHDPGCVWPRIDAALKEKP